MAAVTAVLMTFLKAGDTLVACRDGYPGVRELALRLKQLGVEPRMVPSDTEAIAAAPRHRE